MDSLNLGGYDKFLTFLFWMAGIGIIGVIALVIWGIVWLFNHVHIS